ncbi:MAG: peptide-methionine (S)-S-oxide reductase MsrA [Xanthomonadales bacterium]
MKEKTASFAAGCFWGVEVRFRGINGVIDTAVGYMGGATDNPGYQQVCSGSTGHAESVQLRFDDTTVSYAELLDAFFALHNPTTPDRQGPDFGSQYRSAVFCHDSEQQEEVERKIAELNASGEWQDPVVTQVVEAGKFWRAEEYHQRYIEKNGGGFCSS